jgi:WD40 repeat protein/serine/threonine protein kinase
MTRGSQNIGHAVISGAEAPYFGAPPPEAAPISIQHIDLSSSLTLITRLLGIAAFLHEQGILHRSICPAAISQDPAGNLCLSSFEHALRLGEEHPVRSPPSHYTAPEQCSLSTEEDLFDPRSDLYSIGAVFYELLTKAPPYAKTSGPQLLLSILEGNLQAPADCPGEVAQLCMQLLSRDKQERPSSALIAKQRLDALIANLSAASPSAPRLEPQPPPTEPPRIEATRAIQGQTLEELLKEKSARERMALLPHLISAAELVSRAHQAGTLHQRLTTRSIVIGPLGETMVLGWGAAPRDGFTNAGEEPGSFSYTSPELARGDAPDVRADVYSLGAILYHILSGHPPYRGRQVELLKALLEKAPTPIQKVQPDIPKALQEITERAMARAIKDRYESAAVMAQELQRYQANQLLGEHPYTTRELFWRWYKQSRLWVAAGLSLVVTILLVMMIDNLLVRLQAAETNRQKRRALENEALATLRVDTLFAEKEEQKKRLEELKISQAIAWLDVDPLMSLTWLKEIDREFPNQPLSLARLIAFAAEFRGLPLEVLGVSWSTPECISKTNSQHMVFSWGGERIFSGESDGSLRIWLLKTNQCATIQAHQGPINKIALSPDGVSLVSVGQDGTVLLWNTTYWKKTELAKESGPVLDVSFSPDSDLVAWGGGFSDVSVWNIRESSVVARLSIASQESAQENPVSSVVFHPKSNQLSALRADMALQTWNLKTNKKILERARGSDPTQKTTLLYSQDGSSLVSLGEGSRSFYVVDTKTKREQRAELERTISAAAISPDSRWFAAVDVEGKLSLWDLRASKLTPLRSFQVGPTHISSVQFLLDSDALLLGGDDGVVRVVSLLGEPVSTLLGHSAEVSQVTLSRTGEWAASSSRDHTIRVWDVSRVKQIHGHQRRIYDLAFSSKGEELLTISEDNAVRAWSVSGSLLRSFSAPQTSWMHRAIFSPGGYWVATANDDNTAYLRSINGKEAKLLHTFAQPPTGLDFSGDGNSLWISSLEGTITRWEIPTGKRMTTIQVKGTPEERGLTGIILFPGEMSAATSSYGGVIQLWDLRKEAPIEAQTLRTNLRDLQMAASRNGRYIAAIGTTSTVILWDLEANQSRELQHHRGAVKDIAFLSHDTFITAGAEGDLRVWDVNTGRSVTLPIRVGVDSVTMDQQSATLAFATSSLSVWLHEISFLSVTDLDGWLQNRRLPQKRTL